MTIFILWRCHISLIHSSVDGHLAWFQFGALMRKAVVNVCVLGFVSFGFMFWRHLGRELLALFQFYWTLFRNWQTFFKEAVPFSVLPICQQGLRVLISLTFNYILFKVISHCSVYAHSSEGKWDWTSLLPFSYLL